MLIFGIPHGFLLYQLLSPSRMLTYLTFLLFLWLIYLCLEKGLGILSFWVIFLSLPWFKVFSAFIFLRLTLPTNGFGLSLDQDFFFSLLSLLMRFLFLLVEEYLPFFSGSLVLGVILRSAHLKNYRTLGDRSVLAQGELAAVKPRQQDSRVVIS